MKRNEIPNAKEKLPAANPLIDLDDFSEFDRLIHGIRSSGKYTMRDAGNNMNDDLLQAHQIEPIADAEFVPDPALDALYSLQVATAKQFDWPVLDRAAWEALYKAEIAASRRNHE